MKQVIVGFLGAIAGATVGMAATALCMALGLQSSNWKTLVTINILTGVGGSIVGIAIARDTQNDLLLPRAKVEQAIGKLNGRYELQSFGEDKIAVLKEFQEEISGH